MKSGSSSPRWEHGEILAEVDVYHVGPRSQERGEQGRLGTVELLEVPDGES